MADARAFGHSGRGPHDKICGLQHGHQRYSDGRCAARCDHAWARTALCGTTTTAKELVLRASELTPNIPCRLVIASRESRIDRWQAEHVRYRLSALYPHCSVEIVGMTTRGAHILH